MNFGTEGKFHLYDNTYILNSQLWLHTLEGPPLEENPNFKALRWS